MQTKWILCPVCGNKTRTMIRENTNDGFSLRPHSADMAMRFTTKCKHAFAIPPAIRGGITSGHGNYHSESRVSNGSHH